MYCIGRGLQWLPPSQTLTVLPMALLPWGDRRPGSMRCLLHSHTPLSQCHHHRVRKGATLMLCMSQSQAELSRYGCAYWTAVMITLHSQGTHTHPFSVYSGSLAAFVADVCVDIVGPTLMDFAYMLEQTIHTCTIILCSYLCIWFCLFLKLMLSACNFILLYSQYFNWVFL